jgi:RNase P subunit RPR2
MLKQLKISIKQPYVEKCKTIESLVENQLIPGAKKYYQQIAVECLKCAEQTITVFEQKKAARVEKPDGKMLS